MEILEMKNVKNKTFLKITDGFNIRREETEERIGDLEDRTKKITQSEQQRENRLEKKKINRGSETFGTKTKDLKSNIRIIRVPEGKERGQSGKNIRRNDG